MLQRIRNFLQTIFQQLRPASFSRTEQATQRVIFERNADSFLKTPKPREATTTLQVIFERDTDALYSISTMKKIPVTPTPVRESITEPCRALMPRRNPAQRYRNLDIMLEELRRDRLDNMDTQRVPEVAYRSARHLQYILEQEEGQ